MNELKKLKQEIEDFYNNPNVISLPGRTELNEYEDMVSFVDSLDDNYIRERLYQALEGKGAFKRFKNEIINQNVREKWFKYRDDCLRQKVINWLEENEVEYEKYFTFDYPSTHSISNFEIKDLSGNFVPYSANYDVDLESSVNGVEVSYKRLKTKGAFQGKGIYRITLSMGLDKDK